MCKLPAFAQNIIKAENDTSRLSLDKIKKLSIEELMTINVTSVSKRPEKLLETASAIQVISNEDIRRSGATTLADALRLSPNLQVAQYNSYAWVVSARGFNNVFSNKLLVLIDGRPVYSPLFAGVYWDAQSVPLEDVDRIEVISGPGGTIWGSNAVNGVINVITKKAKDSQGLYLSTSFGNFLNNQVSARYGGNIKQNINYRVYSQRNEFDRTTKANYTFNNDNWNINQGGFRMDYDAGGPDKLSVQANFEGGTEHTNPGPSQFDEQDAMGQWSHTFSTRSDLQLQVFYDRVWRRDLPSTISDQLQTYDIELQHHFQPNKVHNIIWGGEYRLMQDNSQNSTVIVGFLPPDRDLHLYSGFVQDEITLLPQLLRLTLGSKLSHNDYSGFEIQPSARLTWMPAQKQTIWAAVSRAVRTPSRIDVDYHIPTYPVPPTSQSVGGGPDFVSEKLIAYEAGYRIQPFMGISVSVAAFYNIYQDLYSVEVKPGTKTYLIQNGMQGNSQGVELSGLYQILSNWRIRGGYTFFHKNIKDKPGHSFDTTYEGTDPQHAALLQSMFDITKHFELNITERYVSGRPLSVVGGTPAVPEFSNFDARISWHNKNLEIAFVGQNVANPSHIEFANGRIPRNIYGQVSYRF